MALGGDSILATVVIATLRKEGSIITMSDMLKGAQHSQARFARRLGPPRLAISAPSRRWGSRRTRSKFDLTPTRQFYANFTLKETNYSTCPSRPTSASITSSACASRPRLAPKTSRARSIPSWSATRCSDRALSAIPGRRAASASSYPARRPSRSASAPGTTTRSTR